MRTTSRRLLFNCLLAAGLTAFTTLAFSKELPNEVDLQAAYCAAIVKNEITFASGIIPDQLAYEKKNFPQKIHDPKDDELINKAIDEEKFELHRLQAYLAPRLEYLDSRGLLVATRRGEEDISRKDREIPICRDSCREASCKTCQDFSCKNKCAIEDYENKTVKSCQEKCISENETLNRIKTKCNGLTFLPY